jgi:flagellar hook assembly protein FlgD
MKSKIFTLFLLTTVMLTLTAIASDGVNKRLKFARGKSSTVVSGAVIRGDRDTYRLGAKSGQTMSVKITSTENNAVFQIQDADGNFLAGADEGDDAMKWSGALPSSSDYKIIVGGTRGNAAYKLTVSIK